MEVGATTQAAGGAGRGFMPDLGACGAACADCIIAARKRLARSLRSGGPSFSSGGRRYAFAMEPVPYSQRKPRYISFAPTVDFAHFSTFTANSFLPSHIGSLPYASPELLSPSPPPARVRWQISGASGVIHHGGRTLRAEGICYEPRLRAIITAGRYDRGAVERACLMDTEIKEGDESMDKEKPGRDAASSEIRLSPRRKMAPRTATAN
ncbi:hypothetical protein E0198_002528 [Clavispora lusitaniae]|nr:hypothetical protein E0198_002528 [Clavispora lusitaniae]